MPRRARKSPYPMVPLEEALSVVLSHAAARPLITMADLQSKQLDEGVNVMTIYVRMYIGRAVLV